MPVVACPQCGTKLDAPESVLGKEVVCGQCSSRFIAAAFAPAPSEPAAPSAEAPPQQQPAAPTPPPAAGGPAMPPPIPPQPGYAPPYAPQGPYAPPPLPSGNATAGLVLGIISIIAGVFCCCPIMPLAGLICSVLAIVFGGKGLSDIASGVADPASAGRASAGRICGIIGLILGAISLILGIVQIASSPSPFRWNVNF